MARRRSSSSGIPPFEGEGTIIDTSVVDEIESSYLDYSYSVIYSRALPDARDGLKPVHRRILFSMADSGLRPDRPYVKSARVVGDCFAAGTLVRTPSGLRPIEVLEPGDAVMDRRGDRATVTATYENPHSQFVNVVFSNGREVRATPDQLFMVVGDDYSLRWCPARELLGERVLKSLTHRAQLPSGASRSTATDDLASYVLGLFLAEGFQVDRQRRSDRRVRIGMVDPEPLGAVQRWAEDRGLRVSRSVREPGAPQHAPLHLLTLPFVPELAQATAVLSAEKVVPDHVLADERSWPAFLAGVLDGDGYVRKGAREIVFTTTSPVLGRQLALMLDALGFASHHWTSVRDDHNAELGLAVTGSDAAHLAGTLLPHSHLPRKRQALADALLPRAHRDKLGADALPVRPVITALRAAHRGGGWYADTSGERFRAPLDPHGSAEVRYGKNRHGTALLDRQASLHRMLLDGWSEKLERIGSDVAGRLDDLAGHAFATVSRVEPLAERATSYDIQIDTDDHAFVADGVVVHNCMGKYHPHGDGAIYDAMVRLAQPFAMRVPLIDGHGNWGSPDDSAAASRYTECRLTPAALLLTDGLDEETVDLEDNYDGSLQQPSVLPSAMPNLLVNGTSGIAVGMATNMIPHNLVEVVDAARHLLGHPDADLDDLMRFVPGPDLPTGGQLLGMTEVRAAYESGRGIVRMRATAELGALPRGKSSITVTELPYGVGAERVIAKVKELVTGKKLQGIADVKDLTDRQLGTHLVFEVKAGFNPQAVLAELHRLTPLEESFGINNVALVDGQPRTLGLKDLLQVFLDHRIDVVTRRSRYRLRKAQERAHLVEGLLIALDAIDEVVRIIRASADVAEARVQLVAQIGLTELQAGYVLDMQLRRLVALEVEKLQAELASLRETIAELEGVLADPVRLRRVIADELAAVAAEHGTPRRTVLVGGDLKALVTRSAASTEIVDEPCDVVLSSAGLVARTPLHADPEDSSGRRRTGRSRHDVVVSVVRVTTRGTVGLITSAGRVLRVGALDLPNVPAVTTGALSLRGGAPASEFVELQRGERVLGLSALPETGPGIALATRQGTVKRVAPEWPAKGEAVEIVALRPGDEVVGAVELVDGEEELVLFASTGDLLRFPASAVRPQGRSAGGMAGMKLAAGAAVVGFSAVDLTPPEGVLDVVDEPLVVTGGGLPPEGRSKGPLSSGRGTVSSVKVTPLSEYPRKGRATGGVRCQRLLTGEAVLVLGWAGRGPAWAAAASGDPVELPATYGRRDGSGTPVEKPPVAVGRPHR